MIFILNLCKCCFESNTPLQLILLLSSVCASDSRISICIEIVVVIFEEWDGNEAEAEVETHRNSIHIQNIREKGAQIKSNEEDDDD